MSLLHFLHFNHFVSHMDQFTGDIFFIKFTVRFIHVGPLDVVVILGDLVNKGQSFKIDFPISLFPSVFLSQKLTDNDDLQMNYSRRINRPGFWQLFPFTDVSDLLNVSRGNPNLQPEFTNSVELTYSKVFKKNRDNILATAYFKNTNNLITRYQAMEFVPAYDSTMLVSSYVNANSSYVTGLELISKTKLTKW